MASSTAVWYAVSTGERQGAVVSIASLNSGVKGSPLPVAYTEESVSASGHCAAQDSCTSFFDLLMQLLPLPRHSSSASSIGCSGNNTLQPDSPSQPQTTAGSMESLWGDNDTGLKYVPTYTSSSSTQQNLSLGTPQSKRPAAMICPPAPLRPRPTMILVPAEELHMCTGIE